MHKIISDLSFRNGPSTGHCCSLNMKCLPQTDALRVLTSPVDYIIDTFITEWATRIWDSVREVGHWRSDCDGFILAPVTFLFFLSMSVCLSFCLFNSSLLALVCSCQTEQVCHSTMMSLPWDQRTMHWNPLNRKPRCIFSSLNFVCQVLGSSHERLTNKDM